MSDIQYEYTPVGRMVQGDPFYAQTKNMKGAPLTYKDGSPREEYFFALAIAKTEPTWAAFRARVDAIALAAWPGGQSKLANFSWKIVDGDIPKYAEHEGFPGCWIVRCSTGWPTSVVVSEGGKWRQLIDKSELKRGDYVRVAVTIKSNTTLDDPGIYINQAMTERVGFGQEIKGGPDAEALFGSNPVGALPPGASATPVAGTPITPPSTTITPPPPPAAVVHNMTAKAGGQTYEQLTGAGWSDPLLISEGYMVNTAPGISPNGELLK